MTYAEYIQYHNGGDAGVEEKMIASLASYHDLSRWNSFRLAYLYTTTYHIPSALKLLFHPNTPKEHLKFRTDRRYVRIGDNFARIMRQLTPALLEELDKRLKERSGGELTERVVSKQQRVTRAAMKWREIGVPLYCFDTEKTPLDVEADAIISKIEELSQIKL